MFNFFKRSKDKGEKNVPPNEEQEIPAAAPIATPTATPTAKLSAELPIEPTVANDLAEAVTTEPDLIEISPEIPVVPSLLEPEPTALIVEEAPKRSWFDRLKVGLSRTREQIGSLGHVFTRRKIDEDLLEELESTLLMADCGVEATTMMITELRRRWKQDKLETGEQLEAALADVLKGLLQPLQQPLDARIHNPFIIMLAGVNGAGKTTSIGKLARHFQAQGKSVLLAAGDTFRAAAREQLVEWGNRNNVTVIAQDGGDPAAVVFDAINAARARKIDIVLADTAGRLPTQLHLMEEIAKVRRVIQKVDPTGPHEVLLVLDANIGQNALAQLKAFDAAIGVTGLIITKLDGTAKGGVIAAIARTNPRPLRFIGVGEGIEDLQPFNAKEFVDALFRSNAQTETVEGK